MGSWGFVLTIAPEGVLVEDRACRSDGSDGSAYEIEVTHCLFYG